MTRVRGFVSVIVMSGVILFLSVIVIVIMLSMLFVPRNKVIGLRCSWSMYSDDVWKNTNVAAGYIIPLCCCSAAANILSGNIGIYSFSFALVVSSILAIAYAYLVYRVKIADDFVRKPFFGNRFVDVLLIAAAVVSVLLSLWLFSSQSAAFEHVGNKLIATHFNEKNQADGFMKASAFFAFFEKVQQWGIVACVLFSFTTVWFTKSVFGGAMSKLVVAFASAGMSSLACVSYYTGIVLSVLQANSAKAGKPMLDLFSAPAVYYLILFGVVSSVLIPVLLYIKAYANCRRYLSEYKS